MKLAIGFFLFFVLWPGINAHPNGRHKKAKGWKKKGKSGEGRQELNERKNEKSAKSNKSDKKSAKSNKIKNKSSKSLTTKNEKSSKINGSVSPGGTQLEDQYCPRVTNVAVVTHADDSNRKFWDVWKDGAEGALGGSVGLSFIDVGFDEEKGVQAIRDACKSRGHDALVVTVPYQKGSYGYILMDRAIDACAVKGKPIFTTNTDTYDNKNAYAYVGSGNYDMGKSCALAVLYPDNLDVTMGRKEAPPTSSIDRSATYSFYREGEDKNDSLDRRIQGLKDEFKKQGIDVEEFTGFDSSLDKEQIVFVMSMNYISKFDKSNVFLCGDEIASRPDIRQYGQSPFMQGLSAVLTAAAAADMKYKGRDWNTAKGNLSDGVGSTVSTQAVRSPLSKNACNSSPNEPCIPIESLGASSALGDSIDLGTGGLATKPNVFRNVSTIKTRSTSIGAPYTEYIQFKSVQEFSDYISLGADITINYHILSASASVSFTTSKSGSNTRETLIARGYKWDNSTSFDRSELYNAPLNPDFITDLDITCDKFKTDKDYKHFKPFLEAWGTHYIGAQFYGGWAAAKIFIDYSTTSLKNTFLADNSFSAAKLFKSATVSSKFEKKVEEKNSEIEIKLDYSSYINSANPPPTNDEVRNNPSKMSKWVNDIIYSKDKNSQVLVSKLSPWSTLPQVKTALKGCGPVFNPDKMYPDHVYTGRSLIGDVGKATALVDYALTFVDTKLDILPDNQKLINLKSNFTGMRNELDKVNFWDGYFEPFEKTKREINALLKEVEKSVTIYPKVDTTEYSTRFMREGLRRKRWGSGVGGSSPSLNIWSETDINRGNNNDPYGGFIYRGNMIFDMSEVNKDIRGWWEGKVYLYMYVPSFRHMRPWGKQIEKVTDLRIWRCSVPGGGRPPINEATAVYPIPCSYDSRSGTIYKRVNTDHQHEWLIVDVTKLFDAALPIGDLHLQLDFPFNYWSKNIHIATKEYTVSGSPPDKFWPKLVFD